MKFHSNIALLAALAVGTMAGSVHALEPFVATYQVFNAGKRLGQATMQLAPEGDGRWRVDMDMRGTRGLTGLAGANAQQSTVFDVTGDTYRPLSQSVTRKVALAGKRVTATYDWNRNIASWSGDVKPDRAGPVTLQPGDLDALLVNLAVIRDLGMRRPMKYRLVDSGRTKQMNFVIAGKESIDIDGKPMNTRLESVQNDKATVIWVADGLPAPARMLQREKGQDASDLRLVRIE